MKKSELLELIREEVQVKMKTNKQGKDIIELTYEETAKRILDEVDAEGTRMMKDMMQLGRPPKPRDLRKVLL